jgi:hypothetical protein
MPEELDKQKLKTVVQISQYVEGQFIKGSKAHTVYGCNASDIIALLEPLREKYKKDGKPPYVIRMQISEYQREKEKYRKQRGGCITLYDVFINDIFEEVGELLENVEELTGRGYEAQIHHGMWCLCRQSAGKSVVLEIDPNPHRLFAAKEKYNHITYVIDPEGKVTYKGEVDGIL